jgi:hypothetical protein
MFQYTSAFTDEGTQSRCAWVSSRVVKMSDIDVEELVEAVALAESNGAQTRPIAVSLAFSEGYSDENGAEDDADQSKRKRRHIERNRERDNEEFSSDYLTDSATYTDDHFQ